MLTRRTVAAVAATAAIAAAGVTTAVVLSGEPSPDVRTQTFTNENVVTYTVPDPVTETTVETTTETVTVTAPSSTSTAPVPARFVLWGASTPPRSTHGTTTKEEEARWIEARIGRKLGATRHYVKAPNAWTGDGAGATVTSGRIPVISFTSGGDSWTQVANGSLDAYVTREVTALRARGGLWTKAIVGFENEPEAESPGKGTPAQYVAAFQHVIKVGDAAGFPGSWTTFLMEFSWQAASGRTPEAWVPPSVDLLGVHGYATRVGSCGGSIRSFVDTFDGPHATAVKLGKRMGIFELGYATAAGADPAAKGAFFRSIPGALRASLPRVDAITYWNSSGGGCSLANSYYLDSSQASLDGFRDAGLDPIFNP